MSYIIKTEAQQGYLQITATGTVADLNEFKRLNIEYADIIAAHDAENILVDEIGLMKPTSLLGIMEVVASYEKEIPHDTNGWKIALVVRKEFEEVARFWELQVQGQGYDAAVFTTHDDAIRFLSGG